jgi:hypothetical protein
MIILATCSTKERTQNSKVLGGSGTEENVTGQQRPGSRGVPPLPAATQKMQSTCAIFKERQLGVVQRGVWPTTARAWGTRVILATCSTEEREQNFKVFGRLPHREKCDWLTTAKVPRRPVIASCNAQTHRTGAIFKERQLGIVPRCIWPMTARRARWYVHWRLPRVRKKQWSGPSFWTVTKGSIRATWRQTKIFCPLTSCQ